MDDISKILLKSKQINKEIFALRTYERISYIFSIIEHEVQDGPLSRFHKNHEATIKSKLLDDVSFCKAVHNFLRNSTPLHRIPPDKDPLLALNLCAILLLILEEYSSIFQSIDESYINRVLINSLREWIRIFLNLVNNQNYVLRHAIGEIIRCLSTFHLEKARVILLELPVGNSIPVQLMSNLLADKHIKAAVCKISLQRNDSKRVGITRKDLLEIKLQEFGLQKNDIIVYPDEWYTGINFYNISSKIVTILINFKENVFFMPIGLLGEHSCGERNYRKYCECHDSILKKLGLSGNDFRFIFPKISTPLKIENKDRLYWGEYDRIAGYRKMQFLGTVYSSIDWAINEIIVDKAKLMRAKELCLMDLAESTEISKEILLDQKNFLKFIRDSYKDYLKCKDDILKIKSNSNLGEIVDFDSSLQEICTKISMAVDKKPAKACVAMGIYYLTGRLSMDPVDRFYFRNHAPVVVELPGKLKILNDIFIEEWLRKYS